MKHDLTLRNLSTTKSTHWRQWALLLLSLAMLAVWTLTNQTMTGSAAEPEQANLLQNGSFENGPEGLALTSLPGWAVTRGTVDVLNNTYQQAADGNQSLDLIGSPGVGTISQTFSTETGRRYVFSGWVAHHPGIFQAGAIVSVNNQTLEPLYHSGSTTASNMGWVKFSREFVASASTTTLSLADRNLDGYEFGGLHLDGLTVTAADGGGGGPLPTVGAAVIIDGTDANEHGDNNSGRSNDNGWLYMQKVLENLASRVPAGTAKVVVDLGTSTGTARRAIDSAFNLSSLPNQGWTIRHEDGATAIANWLSILSSANTGILYIPTYNLAGGDLDAPEMAAINVQARRIADFVNRVSGNGGALFAMGEVGNSSNPGAWDWLRELFPGIVVAQSPGTGGINTAISLTAEGTQAFPGLSNTEVGAARPWHNYFTGDLATLKVLGVAPEGTNGPSRQVVLGGVGIVVPPPTPTQNRVVRLGCGSASPGGQLQVPVELVSQGDENALGFSLNFDPNILNNPQVARGSATGTALLNINSGQVGQGRIGVALALPSGQTFSTGARQSENPERRNGEARSSLRLLLKITGLGFQAF